MVDISSGDKKINITVSTSGNKASVNATPDTAMYYSNKSREWAISDKIVDNEDYSSKYYAEKSKESAELSGTYADNANGYLQDMTVNYTEYMENLTNSKNTALDEISTLNTSSLAEIETAKTGALTDIDTLHVDSVNDITNLKNTSLSEIETTKTNAISDITNQEALSVDNVNTAGQTQVDTIKSTGETEYNKIIETGIDYKASIDLDNLSEVGEKHFLNKQQITNCLTEVPQRIKYTLENGTLTIKAGSVVIVPYGTEDLSSTYTVGSTFLNDNFKVVDTQFVDSKFFVWAEIQNDLSITYGGSTTSANGMFFIDMVNGAIYLEALVNIGSGTGSTTVLSYYNTTTNNLTHNQTGTISLPILECTYGTSITNSFVINQVFNGMGYIGSTVWVDKGVKGLIPNGRNEDGSLKNIEFETDEIKFYTDATSDNVNELYFGYNITSDAIQVMAPKNWEFDYDANFWVHNTAGKQTIINLGTYRQTGVSGAVISNLNPKQPFQAADAQDIDGRWVYKQLILYSKKSWVVGTTTYEMDLSDYLPKDNNIYEVIISGDGNTGATSSSTLSCYVYTDIMQSHILVLYRCKTSNAVSVMAGGCTVLPVGAGRKIYNTLSVGTSASGTTYFYVLGYRKVR